MSPVPLPSGVIIQAEITETFTLASGDVAPGETRYEDIVLSRVPDDSPAASFPITSSLSAGLEDVVSGTEAPVLTIDPPAAYVRATPWSSRERSAISMRQLSSTVLQPSSKASVSPAPSH